jgi:hypothetical protein
MLPALAAPNGLSQALRSVSGVDPMVTIEGLGEWSEWVPFADALAKAPKLPGVYMLRDSYGGPILYVGMAGERRGSRDRPQGLRGRLTIYSRGRGLVSGLGEAAMDRALADPDWIRERLAEVERGEPMRAKEWGKAALLRAGLQVRWMTTADKATALVLERACLDALADAELWNCLR